MPNPNNIPMWLLGCLGLLCFALSGASHPPKRLIEVADTGKALGTTYDVLLVVPGSKRARAKRALRKTRKLVQMMDRQFSEWRPTSEISKINRNAGKGWVPLSKQMRKLLAGSLHISRVTAGAFDITWAPWGNVWREARQRQQLPSMALRKRWQQAIGWHRVQLGQRGIRFRHKRTKLGIAGVAKGWIIDAAYHALRNAGFQNVIVNIGGDLRTSGTNTKGQQHRFHIADPFSPKRMISAMKISDIAVATSGNYLRRVVIAGRQYGHIVDPRTGMPPPFQGSVTVLTRDASMADALATAMFVMGPKRGLALARKTKGLEVIYATRKGIQTSLPQTRLRATSKPAQR